MFKRKAFQPNDMSQMSEKTAEKVRETYETMLKEGKLPKVEDLDVDSRKERKMKKNNKKNKKKPYKCFEKMCDVCRSSSCCSYKDERANNMKVLNFECGATQQCQLTELQECVDCYNGCFDGDVTIPTNDVTENMTSLFTVKYVKSSFGGKKLKKKNMLEEYFEKDKTDLEKFYMKKAKKHQKKVNKKINKKTFKKQKKNKKVITLVASDDQVKPEVTFDKTE